MNQSCQKPLLQLGATDIQVIEVQKLLVHWNLYNGAINGVFGTALEQAVKVFQRQVFLPSTGVVDASTWRSLYAGAPIEMPLLQRGSTGDPVLLLQEALQAMEHKAIAIDGNFEHQTEAAVRHFQRQRGLVVDGVVGACTWLALSKCRCKQPEVLT